MWSDWQKILLYWSLLGTVWEVLFIWCGCYPLTEVCKLTTVSATLKTNCIAWVCVATVFAAVTGGCAACQFSRNLRLSLLASFVPLLLSIGFTGTVIVFTNQIVGELCEYRTETMDYWPHLWESWMTVWQILSVVWGCIVLACWSILTALCQTKSNIREFEETLMTS